MRWSLRSMMLLLVFVVGAANALATEPRHLEDATLRSVFFIDPKEGWAVGDEGVILHTLDGGKTWERQANGLLNAPCVSLRCVQFVTQEVGWAVGREELPYGMGSAGVILFTRNGGLEWKPQGHLASVLPGMNQVRFVDRRTGFLLGEGSDRFPSGVFRTQDGGGSWEPVPGPRTTEWLAGDLFDGKTGILGGAWSRLATLRDDQFTTADPAERLSGRDITSLQILGKRTLAVAQGGLMLSRLTNDPRWAPLPELFKEAGGSVGKSKWPAEVLSNLDFHAIHGVKDHVWVVGRPGSVVIHSADAGQTWKMHKTGQSLPLHSVFFFDDRIGWAVGDAGTILHSQDGGATWKVQHQAGIRAAGLCIHTRDEDAPVDTLALLGAGDGYLMTSLRLTAPDPATIARGRAISERRYAAAMRQAGAMTGETLWQFPLPQYLEAADKKSLLAHWNQLHDGLSGDELIRQLVLTLRTWRPSVVFSAHPESKVALSALLAEAVLEAIQRAADPKAFPEQIEALGLEPWRVSKLYDMDGGATSTLTQDNDQPVARLNATVRDYASSARALLTNQYTPLPRQRMHQRLLPRSENTTVERHWMEGLSFTADETMRGLPKEEGNADRVIKAILQRRAAIEQAENLDDPVRALALVPLALEKLPAEHAAPAAFAIASQFANRGQWYLAQEVYLYMVDRYPYHPLSAHACRWLIRLNTSGEARRRNELKHFAVADPLGIAKTATTTKKAEKNPIQRVDCEEPAALGEFLVNRSDVREWNKGSLEVIKRLSGHGPVYSFEPATQFCLLAARRQLGSAEANEWAGRIRSALPTGVWHEAAQAELWLTKQGTPPLRRVGRTRFTDVRPHLDGKFDDACWQDYKPMVLDNAVGDTTKAFATDAMFAYDQEFLYIALRCQHPAGHAVAPVKPRPRDAEVDDFDRVSILLDLDRDYSTYYHLEVDQRGCVRDSCSGDRSWNPRWFVAVHSTETCWQIEAAIPLSELTEQRVTPQTAWAFNVTRILPGRGVQSWSQPADVRPCPEGMSLLLFQTGKVRPMSNAP